VDLYAGKIREALTGAIDTRKLAEAWALLHPGPLGTSSKSAGKLEPGPEVPTQLAAKDIDPALSAFLARAAQALRAALSAILRKLWPEGWVLGQQAAKAAVTGDPVDWAGWTPADSAAAEQIAGDGLQRLLADADITIQSIAASRVSDLADALQATLASDVTHVPPLPEPLPPVNSVDSLARALTEILDNPGRARMVAHTEIARAQSAAALDQYRQLDVATKGWLTAEDAKVCPACDADEAAGDIPLPDRFPSGNDAPPGHPVCRCALMPGLARAA
jgi:SPP1 gp7 family putative phage head morphogenesis protein